MPAASVRRRGMGGPTRCGTQRQEPQVTNLRPLSRQAGCKPAATLGAATFTPAQPVASFRRSAATTGGGTNFDSASSSARGVICLSSDDEMCE